MFRVSRFALALVLALPFAAAPAAADDAKMREGATAFIQSLGDRALEVIISDSASKSQRDDRFRQLLMEGFDVHAIAAYCMKQYWRRTSEAERAEYLDLFTDLIVQTYSARLKTVYSGQTFAVSQAVPDGNEGALVRSEIRSAQPGNSGVRVDWRVRWPQGKYKIVDVLVEGISMANTQRDEFVSVIQRNGGQIQPFLNTLRDMVNKLEQGSA